MVKNVIFLAVFLFGYTVQAITGFAGNIFCMPVGTLTLGLQSSVSILNATGFLACTVLAVLYSLIGILIILFLALLLWSLFQQLAMFLVSLYDELSLKLK